MEAASQSRWQHRRDGAADRRSDEAEADAAPAQDHPAAHGMAVPRPGAATLVGTVEIDPSKGFAAARFEALASRQARRAYEASQRVSDDRGASSGNLFDAPT